MLQFRDIEKLRDNQSQVEQGERVKRVLRMDLSIV